MSYGLVLLLGILYHLKNPFYVLENIAKQARHCIISTRVARYTPDKKLEFHRAPMAYLLDEGEANKDRTNYWIFSEAGLQRLLKRTGWEICGYTTVGARVESDPVTSRADERTFCLLKSRMAGPEFGARLLEGWHSVEGGAWRWTERRFSAILRLPSTGNRAKVRLDFVLPGEALARLGSITLSANVNDIALSPGIYTETGPHVYIRDLPFPIPSQARVQVEFWLDKALPADQIDERERGIVVTFLGAE